MKLSYSLEIYNFTVFFPWLVRHRRPGNGDS